IIAARSSEVKGHVEDAFAFMAEAIRSFPDRPVASAQFDPSVSALYNRVRLELVHQGSGSLDVKVDDPAINVFVDEQFYGSGVRHLDKLPPGRHRVFVAKGPEAGRVHDIDISPGGAVSLSISWKIDGALRTSAT